jgi:predicted phage tail protein
VVTFIFNKIAGVPQEIKKQKEAQQKKITSLENKINDLAARVEDNEEAISHYPEYRAQSLRIQEQLQHSDASILAVCDTIKEAVLANGEKMDRRLGDLERREKNSLRAKILNEYRLYTDEYKNPTQA